MKNGRPTTAAETSKTKADFKSRWCSLLSPRTEKSFTKWPVRSCDKRFLKRSAARNQQQNNSAAKILGSKLLNEPEDGSTTRKVLVVEDHPDLLQLLELVLTRRGW